MTLKFMALQEATYIYDVSRVWVNLSESTGFEFCWNCAKTAAVVCDGKLEFSDFGGLVVSMLPSGTQDRGFEPGRSRRIFRAKKNPQHAFLRRGSKAVCPMSQICGT
jgi:hypothetical protein